MPFLVNISIQNVGGMRGEFYTFLAVHYANLQPKMDVYKKWIKGTVIYIRCGAHLVLRLTTVGAEYHSDWTDDFCCRIRFRMDWRLLVQNTIPNGLTTVGAEYESDWTGDCWCRIRVRMDWRLLVQNTIPNWLTTVGAEYHSDWTDDFCCRIRFRMDWRLLVQNTSPNGLTTVSAEYESE